MFLKKAFPITLLVLSIFSCEQTKETNLSAETSKIMALHQAQRDYHFGKDSVAFAHQLSDHFISVNRGKISQPSRQETIARYHGYFSAVEFVKWDDVAEPIIRFSDDGSMAYTIVDKIVTTTHKDTNGEMVEGSTHFAWTAIYRKYGGEWKIDCVTSTEELVAPK